MVSSSKKTHCMFYTLKNIILCIITRCNPGVSVAQYTVLYNAYLHSKHLASPYPRPSCVVKNHILPEVVLSLTKHDGSNFLFLVNLEYWSWFVACRFSLHCSFIWFPLGVVMCSWLILYPCMSWLYCLIYRWVLQLNWIISIKIIY